MKKDELILCYDCGCEIEEGNEYQNASGKSICEDCFYEAYMYCEHCNDVIPQDEAISINNGDFYVCESCARCNYYKCDSCGDYFTDECMYMRNIDLCESCADNYCVCDDCGDFIHQDDVHSMDDGVYCDSCAPEHARDDLIKDAYYKPEPRFLGGYYEPGYYGIELEIDGGHSRRDCAAAIMAAAGDDVYLKYDGSLNNGFEIVTHPATLGYHMLRLDWEGITAAAKDYNFKSHDTNTCGLHVHASRALFGEYEIIQDLNIAKCILLIENTWNEIIVPFSRRSSDRIYEWSRCPRARINDCDSEQTAINKAKRTRDSGRYQAVNLTNSKTVEFRFNRGTLNIETLFAALQFIDVIIKYVKENNLKDVCIKDFKKELEARAPEELRDYLIKRNIIKESEEKICV